MLVSPTGYPRLIKIVLCVFIFITLLLTINVRQITDVVITKSHSIFETTSLEQTEIVKNESQTRDERAKQINGAKTQHSPKTPDKLRSTKFVNAMNYTPPDVRILIYNRVPKCGSTSIIHILRLLASQNGFQHYHSQIYDKVHLFKSSQHRLRDFVGKLAIKQPITFDRHMRFFYMTKAKGWRLSFINVIRDPVERFISGFYFNRDRERWNTIEILKNREKPPNSWFDMKLETCTPARHPDCRFLPGRKHGMQLTFMCGHYAFCRAIDDRKALMRAIMNVERSYSVVGVLENMPMTYKVLEHFLPRFFSGLTSLAFVQGKVVLNKGKNKPNVSEAIKRTLKKQLSLDLEFYDFIKKRLYDQAKTLLV
ncbi:hypothetical protein SK128_007194 [Halocaridina rubra]|uniref:Uncharacterized protein n=1 Tax=Halocaridina rubra TaxID=373956 RepID=A0AAN8ZVY6_HALRR